VSFGGSSTVISLVAIGLLLNISRQPVVAHAPEPDTAIQEARVISAHTWGRRHAT
jgi:hypothetical protein